jgi:hypothetical protein
LTQLVVLNGTSQGLHDRPRLPEEVRGGGIVLLALGQLSGRFQDLPLDGRTGMALEDT